MTGFENINNENGASSAELFNFKDFEVEGQAIVTNAKAQAKALIDSTNEEKQAVFDQAKAAGRKEGLAEGVKSGREDGKKLGERTGIKEITPKIEAAVQGLCRAAKAIDEHRDGLIKNAEDDLVNLVKNIAQRIIKRELKNDTEIITRNLDGIAEWLRDKHQLSVTINPDDKALVSQWLDAQAETLDNLKGVHIKTDQSITPGGCQVESSTGGIDASIETHLNAIMDALT